MKDYIPVIICCFSLCSLSTAVKPLHAQSVESLLKNNVTKQFNILMMSTPASGHVHPMLAIGEELVRRGHNVTLISGRLSDKPESKIKLMAEKIGVEYLYNHNIVALQKQNDFKILQFAEFLRSMANGMLNFWFEELTQLDKEKWDVILFNDMLTTAAMCIHSHDKIPVIMAGTTVQALPHTYPHWPWPQPLVGQVPEDLTLIDRIKVALLGIAGPIVYKYLMVTSMHDSLTMYCPSASYDDLITGPGTSVPYIVPTAIGFEYSRSFMPLSHYVGPLLSKSPDPLPKDLEQWLEDKEERSVVYISMGSVINITEATGKAFVNGVLKTNYSSVWALRQPEIVEGLEIDAKKVFIIRWAPQLSILQHKAISMAIVHGGFNGIHESLYNGVPLIVVPSFGDQFGNAGRVVNRGLGLSLDAITITAEKITSSINEIDSGDYRRNVKHLQKIFISAGGVEKAADLVEYYKDVGFDHLIPAYAKYEWSWVQYYNVDVYGLLAVILMSVIYCSLKCCQCVWRRACLKRKQKRE